MSNHILENFEGNYCPIPLIHDGNVVIGHGSGGSMTKELIDNVFKSEFGNSILNTSNDFATCSLIKESNLKGHICISTDAHVINPIIFPGGDIGRLAVSGTVNDVCMSGGKVLYLTCSFIIEEGLAIGVLRRIAYSIKKTAFEAGVQIVAADTKVVEKGMADKLFISTTGVGWVPEDRVIGGQYAKPDDVVIVSGNLGDHGMAVLAARGNLKFNSTIQSDVAPLNNLVEILLKAAPHTHVLRDPTRGGLATSLNEIANQSDVSIEVIEDKLPVDKEVRAACELLGFDPLYMASEGKLIAILPKKEAENAIMALRSHPLGINACQIGIIKQYTKPMVFMKTNLGTTRVIDMLHGEILPRIC